MSFSRTIGIVVSSSHYARNKPKSTHTRALDVPDDASCRVVHELDAHLRDTTTRACPLSAACPTPLFQRLVCI